MGEEMIIKCMLKNHNSIYIAVIIKSKVTWQSSDMYSVI